MVVEGESKVQLGGEAAGREENQPGFQVTACHETRQHLSLPQASNAFRIEGQQTSLFRVRAEMLIERKRVVKAEPRLRNLGVKQRQGEKVAFLDVCWILCKAVDAQDAAERAAEAAAEAVGGGREGPAAQAAFRAAQSGAVALQGDGLGALGGLGTQIDALKQLVCLPLQVELRSRAFPWSRGQDYALLVQRTGCCCCVDKGKTNPCSCFDTGGGHQARTCPFGLLQCCLLYDLHSGG